MNNKKTFGRGWAALAGVVTIGLATLAGPAFAATGAEDTPPGNTPAGTTGNLIIHKLVGTQGDPGNGTAQNVTGTPLDGVTFTVQRVGVWNAGTCVAIDLRTDAGWTQAATANGVNPAAPVATATDGAFCASGAVTSVTTANGGLATASNLALGLYYVVETDAPANVVEKAAPFYVTVPFPSKANPADATPNKWLYDVNVYPKNSTAENPHKTIAADPSALVVGSDVSWNISQKIPTLTTAGATFTEGSVKDILDSRLTYKSSVVKIGNVTLVEGTDYSVSTTNPVTWTFLQPGLDKLKANQGATLSVDLVTTVTSVGNGTIDNNGPDTKTTVSFNDKPLPPTTTPYTYWGNLQINKVDTNSGTGLAGAEFAVIAKPAGATDCPATLTGTAVATGTSDANGVVQWAGVTPTNPLGLWIANSNNELTNPSKDYCVYETKAPAGYVKIDAPEKVSITTNGGNALVVDIKNTKSEGPHLPLTGAAGTLVMTIGGAVLILLGVGTAIAARKRSGQD